MGGIESDRYSYVVDQCGPFPGPYMDMYLANVSFIGRYVEAKTAFRHLFDVCPVSAQSTALFVNDVDFTSCY